MDKEDSRKRRIIKNIIVVLLSFLVCIALLKTDLNELKYLELYNETLENIKKSSEYSDEYVKIILSESINNNKNLTQDEKRLIENYLWVFAENKKYLDIEYISNMFRDLKIIYTDKKNSINGKYNSEKNTLYFYGVSSISDLNTITWTHELFHTMQKNRYKNNNLFLTETVNTIFNEEYNGIYENSIYDNYYFYTKMLIEIIGSEPFKKYQGYNSLDPITIELSKIYGNKNDALKLLYDLDKMKILYDNLNYENKQAIIKLEKRIVNSINNYYYHKYGINMEEDLIMLSYYDNNKFLEIVENKYLPKSDDKNILVTQNNLMSYFRNDISKNEIDLLYSLPLSGNYNNREQWIIINNENRYLKQPNK